MIKENDTSVSLRQRAETELKRKLLEIPNSFDKRIKDLSESEFLKIIQELELQKIELELQDEELKKAINKAETATSLYDYSPAGYFTLTKDGTIEHLNISAANMLGEDRSMISQNNFKTYISKDSIPVFEDFLQKVFYTKSKQVSEIKIVNLNNLAAEVSVYIEGNISNKGKCLLTTVDISQIHLQQTDIKDQKKEEQKLSCSESKYRRLIESAKDGIVILDAENGNIIDANPCFYQLLGHSQEELINKPLWEIGCFNNEAYIKEVINELQEKGYVRYDNIILGDKQGKLVNVEFTGNIYYIEEKQVIQCYIRNITENIEFEKEIYTLRRVIEQGPSAIVITNAEGKIEFVNNKYTELTQFTSEDVIGKNARIFNKGHLPEHQFIELWETLNKGKTWEGKVKNRRKDNTSFWDETSISAVKNPDGTLSNYILIQNDISEKEQIINDLIHAKEKAVESDILKSAFLANMSHEIRTPLNSIIGFSELIGEPDFDQSQLLHFARIINNSGNKLLSIISDIMDLSKIEAGEVKIDKRKLSVNQLISNIQKEYQLKAIEKGLEIKIDNTNAYNELFVESDENKLRQILINFVGNAIKFTDKGDVELGLQKIGNLVKIYVKDTGIGILDQFKDRIFERFRQVESVYSRKYGGNGLGLAISKALIELLGGQIGMETEYGTGSTFYFTLPLSHQS